MHVTINKILTNTRLPVSNLWHTSKNSLKIKNLLHLTTVNQLFFHAVKFCIYLYSIYSLKLIQIAKKTCKKNEGTWWQMFRKHLDRQFVSTNYVNFWPRLSARHRNLLRIKVGTDRGPRLRMAFFFFIEDGSLGCLKHNILKEYDIHNIFVKCPYFVHFQI